MRTRISPAQEWLKFPVPWSDANFNAVALLRKNNLSLIDFEHMHYFSYMVCSLVRTYFRNHNRYPSQDFMRQIILDEAPVSVLHFHLDRRISNLEKQFLLITFAHTASASNAARITKLVFNRSTAESYRAVITRGVVNTTLIY